MRQTVHKLFAHLVTAVVVFAVLPTLPSEAQTEKIIYSFSGGTDGSLPQGGLIFDANGNIYGTTESGGANSAGTAFELTPGSGGTWTKKVLYSFSFAGGDVALPTSNLVFDAKGNLYGIGPLGGAYGAGGIFELSPASNGVWSEKIIYSFAGGSDTLPFQSGLVIDGAGNLYGYRGGTVSSTGAITYGGIFEVEASSNGTWTEKVLHTFSGGNDGSAPYGGRLALDSNGNLYGQAYNGPRDFGLVFELVRLGNGSWSEKNLHTFTGAADGSAGFGGALFVDLNGNVFGTSSWSVFELVPGSNGTWTEKLLHTFTGGSDGAYPESGLTFGASGKIYGMTTEGGAHHGTVFALSPGSNGAWSERILHRFMTTGGDGFNPSLSTLIIDNQGNLYGTTASGGTNNNGVVFEVTP